MRRNQLTRSLLVLLPFFRRDGDALFFGKKCTTTIAIAGFEFLKVADLKRIHGKGDFFLVWINDIKTKNSSTATL
ncbi:MAG: hypothetical protein RLY35_1266 [Bacteroidota bacterium]